MNFEDYKNEVLDDAHDTLLEYLDVYDADEFEQVWDDLFIDDSVTGNGSGSYTFCAATARENVAELIWDDEFLDILREFGYEGVPLEKGPEALDVIARCLALECMYSEIETRWNELNEGNES